MFPPPQLGLQTSRAAAAAPKGQVVTFLRAQENAGGGWGWEGLAGEGGREKSRRIAGFLFSSLLLCRP